MLSDASTTDASSKEYGHAKKKQAVGGSGGGKNKKKRARRRKQKQRQAAAEQAVASLAAELQQKAFVSESSDAVSSGREGEKQKQNKTGAGDNSHKARLLRHAASHDMQLTPRAVAYLRPLAEGGGANAQYHLGQAHYHGKGGLEKNEKKGLVWWQKAAAQGFAMAQFNLGNACDNGWGGLEKNEEKAVEWWKKAAAQGFAMAQFNLGYAHYNGWGVEKNEKKAVEWCQKAAAQGCAEATEAMAEYRKQQKKAKRERAGGFGAGFKKGFLK